MNYQLSDHNTDIITEDLKKNHVSVLKLKRATSSYVDPAGVVFLHENEILRGIRPEFSEFYRKMLERPIVKQLLGKLIIDTEVYSLTHDDFTLFLKHRMIAPLTYCYEWPPEMLRDAALLTLDLCIELVEDDLVLQDAYPWNVVFEATKPIFIDYTSIVPEEKDLLWVAYSQFNNFFYYPLILYSYGYHTIVRNLLRDYIDGVSDDQISKILPIMAPLRIPSLWGQLVLPRLFQRIIKSLHKEDSLRSISQRFSPNREARRNFFRSLRRMITSIPLRLVKSRWSDYYRDIESFEKPELFNSKQANIHAILEQKRPEVVVDIGCNQGGYSIMAANLGAKVIAFDTDEQCVSLLYHHAKEKGLDIQPLVMNVMNPSPALGWRAQQFVAANQRLSGDMVLALAVVHHLAITQRQSFDRIVSSIADYTSKWLITEFVPLDDPMAKQLLITSRRDMSWYTLDNFLKAIQLQFSSYEIFDSYPEGRQLILCRR